MPLFEWPNRQHTISDPHLYKEKKVVVIGVVVGLMNSDNEEIESRGNHIHCKVRMTSSSIYCIASMGVKMNEGGIIL